MKVKWSRNYMYKILLKDHQHLPKVSIGVGRKKLKKKPKPIGREKKELKYRSKKKPKVPSISEVQPTSCCVLSDLPS